MISENVANESAGDVEIDNFEFTFDNPVILKEFSNIVNLVRNEDILETVPKAKLHRVQWTPLINCMKENMTRDMIQEITSMWDFEEMTLKLKQLEQQKEKFGEINEDQSLWRPQLGDVKAQLRARDVANMQKQKLSLETLAKEYEVKVNRRKKILFAKRGYLKAFEMDLSKYQKKNEEFITKINEKFENYDNVINTVLPNKIDVEEICWVEKDLDKN